MSKESILRSGAIGVSNAMCLSPCGFNRTDQTEHKSVVMELIPLCYSTGTTLDETDRHPDYASHEKMPSVEFLASADLRILHSKVFLAELVMGVEPHHRI